jgi:chorismate mutase
MIKRSKLVNLALEAKTKKSQIIDKERINKILAKIENKSKIAKANSKLIKTIWKSMIWNFIDFEKKEFKKRK